MSNETYPKQAPCFCCGAPVYNYWKDIEDLFKEFAYFDGTEKHWFPSIREDAIVDDIAKKYKIGRDGHRT